MVSLDKNIHIKDYISILKRRKWIVINFFLITVTVITIATFTQKKIYRATATVIVDSESPEVLSVKDVVKLGETNYFAYRDYIETQKEIIKSKRTAYHVIKNLKLDIRKEFKEALDPMATLLKKLKVELIRDTRILMLHVEDDDPKIATLIVNEFAKVYVDSNVAMKIKMSNQAEAWLKEEVEKQKKKVTEYELKLQEYKEASDIISIENQKDIVNDALARLNANYLDAQRKRISSDTTFKTIVNKKEDMTFENLPSLLTDNKTLQQLKDEYLKQEALLTEYKKIYKHKHPKMIRLMENINYLKSRIINEVETQYNSALEEEQRLKVALEQQKKKALELDRKIINYNALKREVETNDRMLQVLLNRLKETSISGQIFANNVRVQDLAEIPKRPIKPKKRLNIAIAVVLGFAGGISLAFFREYMDTSLKDPAEIADILQLPILGSVPKIKRDGKFIRTKLDIDRAVERDSTSLASEAYRSIRTNLLFSLNYSSSSKSIVITSSVPCEGKTLTAVNLAIMIASSGERVLLVDADMRKSRIHTIFNESNDIGLAQFLQGKNDFDEVVKYSGIDNLYLVTAGKGTDRSAELLSSANMKLFLEKAASQFAKIIFDTPPIALVTDAALLSSICTGVVLISEGGKTTKKILSNSKELLQKVDAKILGVIVNNITLTSDIQAYPQYYYGKYYNTV